MPFTTRWLGENHFASNTIVVYGIILLMSGVAFIMLQKTVEKHARDIDALKKAFHNVPDKNIEEALKR